MNYCGIDEAGLGPILGPLSVASCSSSIPPAELQAGLERLQFWPAQGNQKAQESKSAKWSASSLISAELPEVADSKLIYRGRRDFAKLEQLALSLFLAGQHKTAVWTEGVALTAWEIFSSEERQHLSELPWYGRLSGLVLPLQASAESLKQQVRQLQAALGPESLALRGQLLPEAEYNRLLERYDNKSLVLRQPIGRLLLEYSRSLQQSQHRAERPHCVIDRLGGLKFYSDWLRELLGIKAEAGDLFGLGEGSASLWSLRRLQEGSQLSEYMVSWEASPAEARGEYGLGFWVGGDRRHILCAIASIWAKYRRELLMQLFNLYWQELLPGAPQTSGYYQDGEQFLQYFQQHWGKLPPNLRRER